MKFQIKIRVMVYALFEMAAALAAGSIYYFASVKKINERELDSIGMSARQIEQQYDEMIVSMKEPSYYLLSEKDTLAAITSIANMVRSENTKNYFLEAEKTIFSQESNDYIRKRFYGSFSAMIIVSRSPTIRKYALGWIIERCRGMKRQKRAKLRLDSGNPSGSLGRRGKAGLFGGDEDSGKRYRVRRGAAESGGSAEKVRTADTDLHVCVMDERGDILYGNKELDVAFCKKMMQKKDIPAQKAEAGGGIQY